MCRPAAEELLQQYNDMIRWTLLVADGYECQEQEGNFMVAFADAADALEWCLLVQEALMEVQWSEQVSWPWFAMAVIVGQHATFQLGVTQTAQ